MRRNYLWPPPSLLPLGFFISPPPSWLYAILASCPHCQRLSALPTLVWVFVATCPSHRHRERRSTWFSYKDGRWLGTGNTWKQQRERFQTTTVEFTWRWKINNPNWYFGSKVVNERVKGKSQDLTILNLKSFLSEENMQNATHFFGTEN